MSQPSVLKCEGTVEDTADEKEDFVEQKCGEKVLRILSVFSGMGEKGCLREFLESKAIEKGVNHVLEEIDIAKGRAHDVRRRSVRQRLLTKVARGTFDVVITSPPCSTFSRTRWSGRPGPPPPVRSGRFLFGLPRLKNKNLEKVQQANMMANFALELLEVQHDLGP